MTNDRRDAQMSLSNMRKLAKGISKEPLLWVNRTDARWDPTTWHFNVAHLNQRSYYHWLFPLHSSRIACRINFKNNKQEKFCSIYLNIIVDENDNHMPFSWCNSFHLCVDEDTAEKSEQKPMNCVHKLRSPISCTFVPRSSCSFTASELQPEVLRIFK